MICDKLVPCDPCSCNFTQYARRVRARAPNKRRFAFYIDHEHFLAPYLEILRTCFGYIKTKRQ